MVGGSDLGLVRGLLCGLVLLSTSIFRWRNSSPAPPSSSQPILRFDFSVCSVNRVHQSHRRSSFVSSIWVLGLFVNADLSFCHWVSMSIWVLPLGLFAWFVLLKTVKDHLSLLDSNLAGCLPISIFFFFFLDR